MFLSIYVLQPYYTTIQGINKGKNMLRLFEDLQEDMNANISFWFPNKCMKTARLCSTKKY